MIFLFTPVEAESNCSRNFCKYNPVLHFKRFTPNALKSIFGRLCPSAPTLPSTSLVNVKRRTLESGLWGKNWHAQVLSKDLERFSERAPLPPTSPIAIATKLRTHNGTYVVLVSCLPTPSDPHLKILCYEPLFFRWRSLRRSHSALLAV